MSRKILVASYTSDITTLAFDVSVSPPSLSIVSTIQVGHHPSWITPHPTNKALVFTVNEQTDGVVKALEYDLETGAGTVVSEANSGGADPAHLVVVGDELIVGNYSGGTASVIPLLPAHPYLPYQPVQIISFSGSGPLSARQESSHPHQVVPHPTRPEVLIPDLGADKVWRLSKEHDDSWKTCGSVDTEPGGGPRHAVVLGDTLYTLLELSNMLASHRLPPLPEQPTHIGTLPSLSNPPENPTLIDPPPLSAEILIPPQSDAFPTPYLYVTNRNDPSPEGDILTVFRVDSEGRPVLLNEFRTGLNHLRGIAFDEQGRWLIAGGAMGGGVKIFERIEGGEALKEIAHLEEVEKPTGFYWLPTP